MSEQELLDALDKEIKDSYMDEEQAHYAADMLLLKYINNEKITEKFLKVRRWGMNE